MKPKVRTLPGRWFIQECIEPASQYIQPAVHQRPSSTMTSSLMCCRIVAPFLGHSAPVADISDGCAHVIDQAMGVEAARAASYSVAAVVGGPPPTPGGSGELISSALGTKSRAELYEIMAQMKSLVQQNPEQARQILVQNAQLTKALFQAEIMLGMVKGAPIVPSPVRYLAPPCPLCPACS
jgi:hypothetical protein